jgi:hypothetical protein
MCEMAGSLFYFRFKIKIEAGQIGGDEGKSLARRDSGL